MLLLATGCANPATSPGTGPLSQPASGLGKAKVDIQFRSTPRDPLTAARTPGYTKVQKPPNPVTKVIPLRMYQSNKAWVESLFPNIGSLEKCKAEWTRDPPKSPTLRSYCIAYGNGREAYVLQVQ